MKEVRGHFFCWPAKLIYTLYITVMCGGQLITNHEHDESKSDNLELHKRSFIMTEMYFDIMYVDWKAAELRGWRPFGHLKP